MTALGAALSPLAPARFPDLPAVAGVRLASAAAGVRYRGRADVLLAHVAGEASVAAATTRSATRSAAVLDVERKVARRATGPHAVLVNSGNSNAFTGRAGAAAVESLCATVSEVLDVAPSHVLTSSTGVIGEPLPWERIADALPRLAAALGPAAGPAWEAAARAIMTTDTFPKGAGEAVRLPGGTVAVAGIAKGSGMIAPDMGTMLAYVFTDAFVSPGALRRMTAEACERTFNRITVDGDTSTSDTLLVAATGASGVDGDDPLLAAALERVFLDLALQVVRDGEGATRLIEVRVEGAASAEDAKRVGLGIANSPLVKTAVAGGDANWGRVVMAVGKSGATADRDRLAIRFGDTWVAREGARVPDYSEEAATAAVRRDHVRIGVDLGLGGHATTVWTCDLTHGYVDINAHYRS